jgi:hypothetical protein
MSEVSLPKLFKEAPGGWTLFDAELVLGRTVFSPGYWIARAENDDGRTLCVQMPSHFGLLAVEAALLGMLQHDGRAKG